MSHPHLSHDIYDTGWYYPDPACVVCGYSVDHEMIQIPCGGPQEQLKLPMELPYDIKREVPRQ